MSQRLAVVLLLVGFPCAVRAQDLPERDLSARCQLYLRWDGFERHREALAKTALGKTMQGDAGAFLAALVRFLEKQVDAFADQLSPDAVALIKALPRVASFAGAKGLRLGVEVRQTVPADIEATLILPQAGAPKDTLFSFMDNLAKVSGLKPGKVMNGERSAHGEGFQFYWRMRDNDAIMSVHLSKYAQKQLQPHVRLPDGELYKTLRSFREFPVWLDGYVDVAGLVKIIGSISPEAKRLVSDLGLDGLKTLMLHSGPDGPAEHCVLELDMPRPRRGVLRLLPRTSLPLTDLPPMPADLSSFAAVNLNMTAIYESLLVGAESAVRMANPKGQDAVKQGLKLIEGILGVSVRDDLIGALDNRVARYNSPADGPFGFGTVYLIKVKDEAKLKSALDKLTRAAALQPFVRVAIRKSAYHGATIHELRFAGDSSRELPAFAVHKGWLVYSSYPQPIRGFILRANGELPVWKIDADLTRRLAQFPKEYVGIAVSDPRPALKNLLAVAPTVTGMINTLTFRLGPQARFDLSLLPNAHAVTRHLFPNITVITDDGRRVRIETRASLPLPF